MFLLAILALTPLAQHFWLVRAWRVIDAIAWPVPRYLLQSLWLVAVLVVLTVGLDLLVGHVMPSRVLGPWGLAVSRACYAP